MTTFACSALIMAIFSGAQAAEKVETVSQTLIKQFPKYEIDRIAFADGERLEVEFGWNELPAAYATAAVLSVNDGGKPVYRYRIRAKTDPFVDVIWPYRGLIQTDAQPTGLAPISYRYEGSKNEKKRIVDAKFDYAKRMARCTKTKLPKNKRSVKDIRFTRPFDPVGVAYFIRSIKLDVGDVKKFELVEGSNIYLLTIDVVSREKVKVRAGEFAAIRIAPSLRCLSDPEKNKKSRFKTVFMWLSDDEHRLPLKLESEVFVGKVYAELVRYRLHKGAPLQPAAPKPEAAATARAEGAGARKASRPKGGAK